MASCVGIKAYAYIKPERTAAMKNEVFSVIPKVKYDEVTRRIEASAIFKNPVLVFEFLSL